ncbi:MAG: amidohydrolase [Sphaerochaetaceae bacterium]|nr:amidohydrolase [Sphaerochaetaceae bacterium]
MLVLFKNANAIVSCDQKDRVYYKSDLLVENKKIKQIGKNIDVKADRTIDCTGKNIYPGLINTHHHFFQTFVRNLETVDYPNMSVPQWLDTIYPIFSLIDNEVIYYSSLTAMSDLIKHGCTTAFDHQYCYTDKTQNKAVDYQMKAASELGIRYHAGRGCNTLPKSKGSTMPDVMVESTETFIQDIERLTNKFHDPNEFSMSQIVVAPCQPINSYKETFEESVKIARKLNLRLHTHLGEGENSIMMDRYSMRTLDWCEDIGFIGEDVWLAHCWELNSDEYKKLALYKTSISHCPSPAILGGFPILEMKKLKDFGTHVSLGCDGSATNDSSNLLDAMRIAFLMQCYFGKERGGSISSYDVLKMATVEGAYSLGRKDIGYLSENMAADLFMIDASTLELTGSIHDPKNLIARCGVTGNVDLTMINGEVVFENGKLTKIDESKLNSEGEKVCTKILRNNSSAFSPYKNGF